MIRILMSRKRPFQYGYTLKALIVAAFLSLSLSLSLLAEPRLQDDSRQGGYRLLELDGYKVKWGEQTLGAGARVSYAFADETLVFSDAHNCRELAPMNKLAGPGLPFEILEQETAAAFRVWERAADLSFHRVANARDADIILGAQGQPIRRAFANVSYGAEEKAGVRAIDQALVCLNPEQKWKVGFGGDQDVYDIRHTLIHEIGHALGLDHPGPAGQIMGFRYTENFPELQPGDLRGIQRLYGHRTNDSQVATGTDIPTLGSAL